MEPTPGEPTPGDSWTAREITQQPALWREVRAQLSLARLEIDAFLRPLLARPNLRVVLTGAGTSAFAGAVLAPALARQLRRRIDAVPTTDIVSNPLGNLAEDLPTLLVSFARSGDSPESVAATEVADQVLTECFHLVVTCNDEGTLHLRHVADPRSLVLLMPEGSNDRGFAMTSSFTCMLLAALIALGGDRDVEPLAVAADQALTDVLQPATALAGAGLRRVVHLGSGPLQGLAQESALKLLELTAGRIVTYHDSALGFRHGPKAVLDDRTLAVVHVSNDPTTRRYDLDMVTELAGALPPGQVVAVTARPDGLDALPDGSVWLLDGLADVDDIALALPYVVCSQLLALRFSLALGLPTDNPFPSGEVNRVVKGVTIHPFTD
ncbi:MAG TPA: SIS domain-containing protein [Actinomycetales bacterium]